MDTVFNNRDINRALATFLALKGLQASEFSLKIVNGEAEAVFYDVKKHPIPKDEYLEKLKKINL